MRQPAQYQKGRVYHLWLANEFSPARQQNGQLSPCLRAQWALYRADALKFKGVV